MKSIYKNFIIISIISLAITACEKDEERFTVKTESTPTLTADASELVLLQAQEDSTAVTLTWDSVKLKWSEPGYNYKAEKYIIQFSASEDFKGAGEVENGSDLKKTFTVGELNTLTDVIGLTPNVASDVKVRIKAMLGENVEPVYSNIVGMKITPYRAKPDYDVIYMVGNATEGDWDNTKATPMLRDTTNLFMFSYTGFLKVGEFKFLAFRGQWAPSWGSDGGSGVSFRLTEDDPDPANFKVETAGYYTVTLDLKKLEFKIQAYDASTATTHPSIGIIGVFNNWEGVVPMADVYLMYAEAVLRGGGGDATTALQYVNLLRERAYGNTSGNINAGQLTLDFILDERARELKWECHRRTDLIRFNKFTQGTYLWPWKGGVKDGRAVEDFRSIFPIPSTDVTANPNIEQNNGYTK